MKDGLYSVVFTTTAGLLAEGSCLIKGETLVGANFLHGYHGTITGSDDSVAVTLHCRRHGPDSAASLQTDLPEEFDLYWTGSETPYGFVVKTPVPGTKFELLATARHIDTE